MTDKQELSLAGQTLRFAFAGGPTANKTYEHEFNRDGTVKWSEVGGGSKSQADGSTANKGASDGAREKSGNDAKKPTPPTQYESFEVAPGIHLVSYLSADSGYTLTVLANTTNGKLHGFASSSKEWYPLTGRLERAG
jgi:hypothetical protein